MKSVILHRTKNCFQQLYLSIGPKATSIHRNSEDFQNVLCRRVFDEAKKQSRAIGSIEEIKIKTEKKLEKLQNKTESEKDSIIVSEIRKKNWYERYRWFYTSDGLLAIGGRDSSSNTAIIRKHI